MRRFASQHTSAIHQLGNDRPLAHRFSSLVFALGLLFFVVGCGGSTVDTLCEDLKNDDASVCYKALKALETKGKAASPAVPQLIEFLSSNDPKLSYRSIKVLSKMGREAIPAADAIASLLKKNHDEKTRYYAIKTLANIDEAAIVALENLIQETKSKDAKMRYYAAKAIGKIGTQAASAIPNLTKLQNDPDKKVREAAESAIKKIQK